MQELNLKNFHQCFQIKPRDKRYNSIFIEDVRWNNVKGKGLLSIFVIYYVNDN